jgi:hypothetical protein
MDQQEIQQPLKGVFSINEFCRWAGIGRTAAYAEIKAGRLPAKKFGKRTFIIINDAERWLAALPAQRHC